MERWRKIAAGHYASRSGTADYEIKKESASQWVLYGKSREGLGEISIVRRALRDAMDVGLSCHRAGLL